VVDRIAESKEDPLRPLPAGGCAIKVNGINVKRSIN